MAGVMARTGADDWRIVRSPVDSAMLGPLNPECTAVDLRAMLSEVDFGLLSAAMRPRPDVCLFVSRCRPCGGCP
jgi:hypothetical protein